jgi:hypothetical protein
MRGLAPRILVFLDGQDMDGGTSPAMTIKQSRKCCSTVCASFEISAKLAWRLSSDFAKGEAE